MIRGLLVWIWNSLIHEAYGKSTMNINKDGIHINLYQQYKQRYCISCNNKYRIIDSIYGSSRNLYPPVNYYQGCEEYCYGCWVCVEPPKVEKNESYSRLKIEYPNSHSDWYNINNYEEINLGNIKLAYEEYLKDGFHLIILPINRFVTGRSIFLPKGIMIYPEGRLKIPSINIKTFEQNEFFLHPEDMSITDLSQLQTYLSDVTINDLNMYPLIVMPIKLDWDILINSTHDEQLEMIYNVSEQINKLCLNYLRYKFCELKYGTTEQLPSNASQVLINNMSAVLLIKNDDTDRKFIAGEVYSHQITQGMGLGIRQPEWNEFPCIEKEMGKLVNHAISLYIQILETQSATNKFVQILSLLEFLVFPDEYKQFKEVKKRIARYITTDTMSQKYKTILNRFEELTGKRDDETNEILGYRTRIVHMGDTIEDIIPEYHQRNDLFIELDNYIRVIIDDMIKHSNESKETYFKNRKLL